MLVVLACVLPLGVAFVAAVGAERFGVELGEAVTACTLDAETCLLCSFTRVALKEVD